MNEDFMEFIEEFISESEEHINTINTNLLQLEKEFKETGEYSAEYINSIFRAAHTVKGLAGMLGFENIQEFTHAIEDLMGEIRQGNLQLSIEIIDVLFEALDILSQQIEDIKTKGSTDIFPEDLIKKIKNIISGNTDNEKKEENTSEISLDFLDFEIPIENLNLKEIEATLLKQAIEQDLNVYMITKEVTGGISEEKFYKLPIFSDIENVGELIFYRPEYEEISKSKKDSIFVYFIFSTDKNFEEIKDSFFDEIKILRESKSKKSKEQPQQINEEEQTMSEVFRLEDTGFDESILEGFFEEVDELIEKLDMDLLELEKNPDDKEILNSIFRVAHTVKGASSMFGFEPIVKLTHAMENLFDNLRKGTLTVTPEIMDTFFEGVDLLKAMLDSLRSEGIIDQDYLPITKKINALAEGKSPSETSKTEIEEVKESSQIKEKANLNISEEFYSVITDEELEKIKQDFSSGKTLVEISVKYPEDILKTTFKPFEGFFTGLEIVGDTITAYTDISNVPTLEKFEPDKFYMSLKVIVSSDLGFDDVKKMLSGFEDTLDISFKLIEEVKEEEKVEEKQVEVKEEKKVEKVERPAPQSNAPQVSKPKKPEKKDTKSADKKHKKLGSNTIRVDIERLDRLLNLVGEFVIDRTRFAQICQELKEKYPHDPLVSQLNETNQIFGRHMNEIQEVIMSVRMVPIGNTFNKYPRIVRDLARETGKEINLEIYGQETELDKTLVEEISDPLVHLIRNAVDHGIEPPDERERLGKPRVGTIKLTAYHEGNHIVITIEDDGRGIDPEKIRKKAIEKGLISEDDILTKKEILNLIFEPGFSTAEKVTNISGRGVGMDVVKKNITKLKGIVDIESEVGKGTTVTIKLPLTLAIIQVLMVQVESEIFAIPLPSIIETIRISKEEIQIIEGYEMITLRDSVLPITRLKDIFRLEDKKLFNSLSYNNELEEELTNKFFVVIVGLGEQRLGLIVDRLITQQEVVIKSLGNLLKNVKGIAGATILGNGRVALILDIGEVMEDAKNLSTGGNR